MFFGMVGKNQYNYKEITIAMVEISLLLLCVQRIKRDCDNSSLLTIEATAAEARSRLSIDQDRENNPFDRSAAASTLEYPREA